MDDRQISRRRKITREWIDNAEKTGVFSSRPNETWDVWCLEIDDARSYESRVGVGRDTRTTKDRKVSRRTVGKTNVACCAYGPDRR